MTEETERPEWETPCVCGHGAEEHERDGCHGLVAQGGTTAPAKSPTKRCRCDFIYQDVVDAAKEAAKETRRK